MCRLSRDIECYPKKSLIIIIIINRLNKHRSKQSIPHPLLPFFKPQPPPPSPTSPFSLFQKSLLTSHFLLRLHDEGS